MDRRSFFKYASFSGAITAFFGGLHLALSSVGLVFGNGYNLTLAST